MHVISLVKDSLTTVRRERSLWLFGFFAASAGGTGVRVSDRGGTSGAPEWLWPALFLAVLFGLCALALHVVSESALIDGVRHTRRGERYPIRQGFRAGVRCFARMAGVKLAALGAELLTLGAIALPLGAVLLAGGPAWAGALGTAALAITLLPWILSVYFIYEYAMRAVVVEDLGVRAALRQGLDFLHGRITLSLSLAVAAGLGQVGAAAVGLVLLIPVALIGGIVYLAAGSIPAIVVGAALMVPLAACVAGALGTYRSAIWTHGYLSERSL